VLQIAGGKLFTRAVQRENQLRGMLYTNAVIGYQEGVDTVIGKLLPSSSRAIRPQVVVYEFTERMEEPAQGPAVLVSSGVDPYLQDYAIVVAFALNCVCTPDVDLCRRLTDGQRGLATRVAPQTLVRRFFDGEVWCTPEDRRFLMDFTAKLIALPRRTFLGVMRALRTYVNGMYRISDDLELAYTLLVASVESLAQDFDGHQSDWESVDEHKRNALDAALAVADPVVARRVRDAFLEVEHVALARRFREFAIAHTSPEYFRPPPSTDGPALGRGDLKEALALAYQSRSKYVHQLKRLPHTVVLGHRFGETAVEERATHLTLQGLARLMRAVIIEFVARQPVVDREPYDYGLERSGVVRMRMAAQYWVGGAEGDIRQHGRDKLEGFLEQLAACLLKEPDAVITDLRSVLRLAVEFVPGLERRQRLPYLALLVAFNGYVRQEDRASVPGAVDTLLSLELGEPGSEALLVHTLREQLVTWGVDDHVQAVKDYLRRRGGKNGLRFPRVIEAAIILDLAERFRLGESMDECRTAVALAVENYPGHAMLQEFERGLQQDTPIRWRDVLLPRPEQPTPAAA
jgi:hypothetical protein